MAPRRTQSASSQAQEASENAPSNLVEADNAAEQREEDLKNAPAGQDVPEVDNAHEAYKSSHVPGSPEAAGHPGYFPDQYTKDDGPIYGHFCVVKEGDNEGLYGVYIDNVASDGEGRPDVVLVRERNTGRIVSEKYANLAPAQPGDVGRGR